jgi:hypothetical protein
MSMISIWVRIIPMGGVMKVLENVRNVVIHSFGEKQQKQANFIGDAQILMVDVDITKEVTN